LANRRAARSTLAERIAGGQAVGLITVDLDHFKTVNDTWGHERGDEALIAVAEVLRRTVRGDDVVARWGGEEFLIIASIAHGEAIELAERCRVAIESERPAGIALTATFGVAAHEPGDVVDVTLRRADELLYDAKRSGRNRVEADHGV
ncbi:MAG: GGDEF domain-containing protein, partial [Nitriliruptoraceae bacterium]